MVVSDEAHAEKEAPGLVELFRLKAEDDEFNGFRDLE